MVRCKFSFELPNERISSKILRAFHWRQAFKKIYLWCLYKDSLDRLDSLAFENLFWLDANFTLRLDSGSRVSRTNLDWVDLHEVVIYFLSGCSKLFERLRPIFENLFRPIPLVRTKKKFLNIETFSSCWKILHSRYIECVGKADASTGSVWSSSNETLLYKRAKQSKKLESCHTNHVREM